MWWRKYLWRRFVRIFPLYLLLHGLLLFMHYGQFPPGQGRHTLALVLLSQSLLRGLSSTLKYVGIPQGWSLTVEGCFYLAAPLLLGAWARYGSRGAASFVAVVMGSGLLLTYLCTGHPALHGFFGSYYHLINYTFFGRVLEFVIGVGLARWWAGRPAATAPRWPWRTVAGGLLMGLAIGLLVKLESPSTFYDGLLDPAAIAVHLLLFPAGAVVLLAGLLAEHSWPSTAGRAQLAARFPEYAPFGRAGAQLLRVLPAPHWGFQHLVAQLALRGQLHDLAVSGSRWAVAGLPLLGGRATASAPAAPWAAASRSRVRSER
ncbi:peptidoglycan/LPS O-acetylase OafA/YrhL [Hymenobacter sp. UYCo722]